MRQTSAHKGAEGKQGAGVKKIKTHPHVDPWNNMAQHITMQTEVLVHW